jgi:hypothetical protein
MNRAHDIHQAILSNRLSQFLASRSVRDYLGADWVSCHPRGLQVPRKRPRRRVASTRPRPLPATGAR